MKRRTSRSLSILLALAMVLALLPAGVHAAPVSTSYVNETGKTTSKNAEPVPNGVNRLTGTGDTQGWYVVNANVSTDERVEVTGNVSLILANGCKLTASKGIHVPEDATLTIYGQSSGSGTLVAGAVIDPTTDDITGTTTDDYLAGIGGNYPQANGPISIYGGKVYAAGGYMAAGIGSGIGSDGTDIEITGGTVTATGGYNAAGIGGGDGGSGRDIKISGGAQVTATGGDRGAGIGGGSAQVGNRGGDGNGIKITGGTVTATGGSSAAGIGGGNAGNGSDITITGGTVTAIGGSDGAGIGGGTGSSGDGGDGSDITISGGTVTATGGTNGAGIGGGEGTVGGNRGNGSDIEITGGTVTATGGRNAAGIGGGSYADGRGITISGNAQVTAYGGGGDKKNPGEYGAGIGGGNGGSGTGIKITDGTVTATAGSFAAGIGGGAGAVGDDNGNGSDITISGNANVTATGGNNGAGIGSGANGTASGIEILSGTVTAAGGSSAAGIGSGNGGSGSGIKFSGGVTVARSDSVAIDSTPVFDSFPHVTYGNTANAESTKMVESTRSPSTDWSSWKWVKIQPGNSYIVSFDPNGGSVSTESSTTGGGDKLTSLPTPTRKGYTFKGWYTAASGGTKVTTSTVFSEDATIYAQWAKRGGSSSTPTVTPLPTPTPSPEPEDTEIISPVQSAVKDGAYGDWIDRIDLPEYAYTFYDTLTSESDSEGITQSLIKDEYFTIDPDADGSYGGEPAQVLAVETLTIEETPLFADADGDAIFNTDSFLDKYTKVDVTAGDTRIDYAALKEGDVVKNSTYNGIFAAKILYDEKTFDALRTETCSYIAAAYHAFDRDHPEIFWLSGKSMVRMLTTTVDYNGTKRRETFFFFVLADKDGFTLRSDDYRTAGAVDADIAKRDAAVQTILATVDKTASRQNQVKALNKWLTEHNAYNSSADLTKIGNNPHECLAALVGTVGTTGPVCDGYSRAFKVLCDKLGIPCTLADGNAKTSANGASGAHMWNNVQMNDGNWYGVDVTWNDPVVSGRENAAVSGRENENYLLVGKDTEIRGLTFAVSHPEKDRVATGGVSFYNGLQLSPVAYSPNTEPLFTDVAVGEWYYDAVMNAAGQGLIQGVGNNQFAPARTLSRAEFVTLIVRLVNGGEPADASGEWYAKYYAYANAHNLLDGIGANADVTALIPRYEMAQMIYNAAKAKGMDVSASKEFTDNDHSYGASYDTAIRYAYATGLLTGKDGGNFAGVDTLTRAEAATVVWRFYKLING